MRILAFQIPGYEIAAPTYIPTSSRSASLNGILSNSFVLVFIGAALFALFLLIWGGIMWITSEGDKQKLAAARSRIVYALIGLVLVFMSFFIVNVIMGFFGIKYF